MSKQLYYKHKKINQIINIEYDTEYDKWFEFDSLVWDDKRKSFCIHIFSLWLTFARIK